MPMMAGAPSESWAVMVQCQQTLPAGMSCTTFVVQVSGRACIYLATGGAWQERINSHVAPTATVQS